MLEECEKHLGIQEAKIVDLDNDLIDRIQKNEGNIINDLNKDTLAKQVKKRAKLVEECARLVEERARQVEDAMVSLT